METSCNNSEIINSSYFGITSTKQFHLNEKQTKGEDLFQFGVKADLMYKIRKDLSISDKDKKMETIGIITKECKKNSFHAVTGLLRV